MPSKKKIIKNKTAVAAKAKKNDKKSAIKSAAAKGSVAKKPIKKTLSKVKKAPSKTAPKTKKITATKTTKAIKKIVKPTVKVATKVAAKVPAKNTSSSNKKTEPVTSSLKIKSNLAELMPEYDRQDEKIDDDYMNEDKKIYFRSLLNNWKKQLMQEVDRTVDYMKDEATNFPDPVDRATQEEEFSLELRTRDRERKLIKKIDEALERLDDNEYGYCEACGIEIGYKRLEARPTATLCIDCKTIDEIRERQLAIS